MMVMAITLMVVVMMKEIIMLMVSLKMMVEKIVMINLMMVLVKLDEGEILQFSFVGISTFFEANL